MEDEATRLNGAIRNNNIQEVVNLLQRYGNRILKFRDMFGDFPMIVAVQTGDVDLVRYLLDTTRGLDPAYRLEARSLSLGTGGYTPIMIAASNGNLPMVRLLLEYGAQPFPNQPQNNALSQYIPPDVANQSILTVAPNVDIRRQIRNLIDTTPILYTPKSLLRTTIRPRHPIRRTVKRRSKSTRRITTTKRRRSSSRKNRSTKRKYSKRR